jgi:hypothetical protein
MLRTGIAAGVVAMLPSAASVADACQASLTLFKPKPEKAISLKRLSTVTAASGRLPRLEGLTRLDGFITDPVTRDVIVWGLSERNQPELQFDDFVIALRASFGRYDQLRGNTLYRTPPLISIDPDPAVFQSLEQINVGDAAGKRRFNEVCGTPQTVRVEGMPRNTRLAKILVDADYRMKKVSQGTVTLPIATPFQSHHDAQLAEWRAAAMRGDNVARGWSTRYWFEAGRFNYQGSREADMSLLDGDTVFFESAEVTLRDEDQRLAAQVLAASGRINPLARAFSCAWTRRMDEVYRSEPIWRDMHNMFRHVAVARVMAERKALARVDFGAEFLLERYAVTQVPMPATLPGLGRVGGYSVKNGAAILNYATWVCGGIAIDFSQLPPPIPPRAETRAAASRIIARRPDPSAVSWRV